MTKKLLLIPIIFLMSLFGQTEDNSIPINNFWGKVIMMGDSLVIVDDTGADSTFIYDDGTNFHINSNNPTIIDNYTPSGVTVTKSDILNSGTLSFDWADGEIANDITASNYLLLTAFIDSLQANDDDYLIAADLTGYTEDTDSTAWNATKTWVGSQSYLIASDIALYQEDSDTTSWDATKTDILNMVVWSDTTNEIATDYEIDQDILTHKGLPNDHHTPTASGDIDHDSITNTHNLSTDIVHSVIDSVDAGLTGVLRSDGGVLSVDGDVTDLVTFTPYVAWTDTTAEIATDYEIDQDILTHKGLPNDHHTPTTSGDIDHDNITNTHNLSTDMVHSVIDSVAEALTGVLRSDSGVLSIDSDVTDLVTFTPYVAWTDTTAEIATNYEINQQLLGYTEDADSTSWLATKTDLIGLGGAPDDDFINLADIGEAVADTDSLLIWNSSANAYKRVSRGSAIPAAGAEADPVFLADVRDSVSSIIDNEAHLEALAGQIWYESEIDTSKLGFIDQDETVSGTWDFTVELLDGSINVLSLEDSIEAIIDFTDIANEDNYVVWSDTTNEIATDYEIDQDISTHDVADNHLNWKNSVGTIHIDNYIENVSTSLSLGTPTGTTVLINSDGSSPDVTLIEATTTTAGLLGASKWDDIVANSSFTATPSTVITAGDNLTWDGNTLDATGGGSAPDDDFITLDEIAVVASNDSLLIWDITENGYYKVDVESINGGFGDVFASGTPSLYDMVVWTDANTIRAHPYFSTGASYRGFAIGENSVISGDYSVAIGEYVIARGNHAFAAGESYPPDSLVASGRASVALGYDTKARGIVSFAWGHDSEANGDYSLAFGYDNITNANLAYTFGSSNYIDTGDDHSYAIGLRDSIYGQVSYAFGKDITLNSTRDFAWGDNLTIDNSYGMLFGLDNAGYTLAQSNTMAIMGGKVGIENLAPDSTLDVTGSGHFSTNLLVENELTLGDDVGNTSGILKLIASDGDEGTIEITSSDVLRLDGFRNIYFPQTQDALGIYISGFDDQADETLELYISSSGTAYLASIGIVGNMALYADGTLDIDATSINANADIITTASIGRDVDNEFNWNTDNILDIVIGGVTHAIASISTGTGDNDKLVTQGYVDDNGGGSAPDDDFITLGQIAEVVNDDSLLIWDTSLNLYKKVDKLSIVGAGGGDVTSVGTPVDNQIGIWTGDPTLEGDPDLTFDGDTLRVKSLVMSGATIGLAGDGNENLLTLAADLLTVDGSLVVADTMNIQWGLSIGQDNALNWWESLAVGDGNVIGVGGSAAIGESNTIGTNGYASLIVGGGSSTEDSNVIIVGYDNHAAQTGDGGQAFGQYNEIDGYGGNAFVVGWLSNALGYNSFVAGYDITVARSADYSVLFGLDDMPSDTLFQANTFAIIGGQVVIGDTVSTAIFSVTGDQHIKQSVDDGGLTIYGFDDKSTDSLDFYINNNGAGRISTSSYLWINTLAGDVDIDSDVGSVNFYVGDDIGAQGIYLYNDSNQQRFGVTSEGNLTLYGTVDGIDIATDVGANNAFRTTPSTIITAGTNIDWSGNTLNVTGGSGDVTAVPTPSDNQIGVWTGGTTLEGDPNFTWDGNLLRINQAKDADAISIYGYDDENTVYLDTYIDNGGYAYTETNSVAMYYDSGGDIGLVLGDNAGANTFALFDSDWAGIFTINSDGAINSILDADTLKIDLGLALNAIDLEINDVSIFSVDSTGSLTSVGVTSTDLVTINQSADADGFQLWGWDDKSSDGLEFYIAGSGTSYINALGTGNLEIATNGFLAITAGTVFNVYNDIEIGTYDVNSTGAIGRDVDNELNWNTDDILDIVIGGVTHAIASISTGTGDNDKLVTQGYVDDEIDGDITTHNVADNHLNWKNSVGTIDVGNYIENVSTSLTLGTRTATTNPINSDGSSPDITLIEADTDYAGLLGADKWDDIVSNSAFTATPSTVIAAGTGLSWSTNTLNADGIANLSEDSSPQLGEDLDMVDYSILWDSSPSGDHQSSGDILIFTNGNGGSVNYGDVCYMADDGDMEFGDADSDQTAPAVVMANATITTTSSGEWLVRGVAYDATWNWTSFGASDGLIYLTVTATTGNTMSQTPPVGVGDQVDILGWAIDADTMYFNPQLPMAVVK